MVLQTEDDMAEKLRSNEMLLKAVNTYREAAELPDAPADLIKATLKRCADRQQFLGKFMRLLVRPNAHTSRSILISYFFKRTYKGLFSYLGKACADFPRGHHFKE